MRRLPATHAITVNGRATGELQGDRGLTPQQHLREVVSRLEGVAFYALCLWAMPPGQRLADVDLRRWPQEYLQAAGSQERMTLEVRRLVDDEPFQYVLGHRMWGGAAAAPDEVIRWNGHTTAVRRFEVFTGVEAADVFSHYLATGWVPESVGLRHLPL
ncbi:hypothetical protein [Oryzihumus sp.]|uniref:hypothetical protein n=1 Tax=Oryzihumus sp. TaxID=1968903 RepID=UPI002EDA2323